MSKEEMKESMSGTTDRTGTTESLEFIVDQGYTGYVFVGWAAGWFEVRAMWRLKATKTSLSKLVGQYEKLPSGRKITFRKAYRTPDYWLEWMDGSGLWCRAFFSPCMGTAMLSITKKDPDGPEASYQTYTLNPQELKERGMLEEYQTAAERRQRAAG